MNHRFCRSAGALPVLRCVLLVLLVVVGPLALGRPASVAAVQDRAAESAEAAQTSLLTGVALSKALRITDESALADVRAQLTQLATAAGAAAKAETTEVLAWPGDAAATAPVREKLLADLKAAGWTCETREGEKPEGDAGGATVTLITAQKGNQSVLGFFGASDQALLLAWCRLEQPKSAAEKATGSLAATGADAGQQILAAGEPPLTRQMTQDFSHFIAWLLEAPLTVEQKQKMEQALIESWKKGSKEDIKGIVETLDLRAQIWEKNETERAFIRKQVQPELLKHLRTQKSDPAARWILAIYDSVHRPLVAGSPPLTRQMTDAYTEVLFFMISELGDEKVTADKASKDGMAKALAKGYSRAPAAFRQNLAKMPLLWAAIRVAWPQLPEAEKQAYRVQWAKDIQAMFPRLASSPSPVAAKTGGKKTARAAGSTAAGKKGAAAAATTDYKDFARRMQALQAQQQSFRMMSNFNMQMHYSRMNSINTMGGNPYRYVNAAGNPY